MGKLKEGVLDSFERVHDIRYILYAISACYKQKKKYKQIKLGKHGTFLISDIKKIKKAVEKLDNFDGWENFNMTWDVMWVGLDIRYAIWIISRHNSPIRQLIKPIRLIKKHKGHVMMQAKNSALVQALEVPEAVLREREKMFKSPAAMAQLDKDEKVTEFLTGDVSAKITKEATKKMLEDQMKALDDDD